MPIHLTSRRQFVAQLSGAVVLAQTATQASAKDDSLIAILNDTHIGEIHPEDSPVPSHLRESVAQLIALPNLPVAVVINGDLALNNGQPGDYIHFMKLISPLRKAGISVHLTLGNHDDRQAFHDVLKNEKLDVPPVKSKHVSLVQTPKANLLLLDSLKEPNLPQGLLGADQCDWIGRILDAHADKPTLVFAHHNPRVGGDPKHFPGGLEDSEELWQIIAPRSQVKAYVHGHIHHRDFYQHRGIHLLNTPATSFVSNPSQSTTGWTMLRLVNGGAEVTTRTHLPDHAWNGATVNLKWRV